MKAHHSHLLSALAIFLLCPALLLAQKEKREPLSAAQIEEVREAAINPALRIQFYVKFLNQHADTLQGLNKRIKSAARAQRLREELLDFTELLDELSSNLDQYGDRKADLRPAFKPLSEALPRWNEALHALTSEPAFDIAQKEAFASLHDLTEQSNDLIKEQTEYFKVHKQEKDQQRAEPKE